MSKLRQRIETGDFEPNETVIFTTDYTLNIAYMTDDYNAFNIHWAAFSNVARMTRLLVWSPIDSRAGKNLTHIEKESILCEHVYNQTLFYKPSVSHTPTIQCHGNNTELFQKHFQALLTCFFQARCVWELSRCRSSYPTC